MAGYSITPDELNSTSTQISQAASEIEQILGRVKSQVDSTTGFWKGQSQANFQTLMERWTKDSQDLHQVLTLIASNMAKAAQNYSETESGVAQGFQL